MILETIKRYYTPEEYLELEEQSEDKNEYRDGEIVPMAGGTTNHNTVALNFATYINLALIQQNYRVFMEGIKVWIGQHRIYTYPDVMVIEGQPIYEGKGKTTVTNPSLIVEVLSKSTKNYDLGNKFIYYRSIPQFQEYILIEQQEYRVMQYAKTAEGKWLLSEYVSENAILSLSSVQFEISLRDLYKNVDFAEAEE